jgi:hypothetical protein
LLLLLLLLLVSVLPLFFKKGHANLRRQVGVVFGWGFWSVIFVCDQFWPPCVVAVAVLSIGSHSPVLPGGQNKPTSFLLVASCFICTSNKGIIKKIMPSLQLITNAEL